MKRVRATRGERGSATVFVVGAFLALLLIVGMSVDFGIFLRYRRAMANACDSGVLAGGLNLRSSPDTAAPTAERYATNDMRNNAISWSSIVVTTQDDSGNPTLISPRRIRAVIQSDVPTFFLRLVRPSVHVAVSCAARLTPIILAQGLVPLGLSYDDFSGYGSACLPLIQAGVPLDQRSPPCDVFTIRYSVDNSGNPLGGGNTGAVAMVPGCYNCNSGARNWGEVFAAGSQNSYCIDEARTPAPNDVIINGQPCATIPTQPGNFTGRFIAAVTERCSSENPLDHIIMMPLLNPDYQDQWGRSPTEIWGFAAYQMDCTQLPRPGNVELGGGFVSLVTMQAYGTEAPVDTGVYTVRLIQ